MATTLNPDAPLPAEASRFSPSAWAARRGVHYGWLVVAVTFVIVVTAAGVRATPGVLIRPLEREFGWHRSEISLAIACSLLFYGIAAPLSGRVADRWGLRAMTLVFLATSAF